jgi:hypothetical protein
MQARNITSGRMRRSGSRAVRSSSGGFWPFWQLWCSCCSGGGHESSGWVHRSGGVSGHVVGPVDEVGWSGHATASRPERRQNGIARPGHAHFAPLGLTGRPDRLIKADGSIIVEEWKSSSQCTSFHRSGSKQEAPTAVIHSGSQ